MKSAVMMIALVLLLPAPAMADGVLARQLHYVGTTSVNGRPEPMTLDLDIGAATRYGTTRIFIDEHVRDQDVGGSTLFLDRTGIVPGYHAPLTFEEETVLDMLALQFENMTGLGAGDSWDRAGELQAGTHETHYTVRGCSGSMVDLEVARTIEFQDGTRGSWRGVMTYNSATVVPTALAFNGIVVDGYNARRPFQLSARLEGDSFRP